MVVPLWFVTDGSSDTLNCPADSPSALSLAVSCVTPSYTFIFVPVDYDDNGNLFSSAGIVTF